ncbi:MAG: hypothetical protein JZD41_07930, partial [Thermoproteus sp.]|nr:hypothetical protein [Thermoproteus sp.]
GVVGALRRYPAARRRWGRRLEDGRRADEALPALEIDNYTAASAAAQLSAQVKAAEAWAWLAPLAKYAASLDPLAASAAAAALLYFRAEAVGLIWLAVRGHREEAAGWRGRLCSRARPAGPRRARRF